ncbi:MAG: tetratricopeptide repeat protein [Longimicrobiales bacterium]
MKKWQRVGWFALSAGGVMVATGLLARATTPASFPSSISAEAQLEQRELQIRGWQTALDQDSASAIALAQLAGLYLQRGRESGSYEDYPRAESYARRSLALRTQRNGMTFVTLASSLLAQHEFVEARDVASTLVQIDPDIPQYRALLGETQLELGDYAGAAKSFAPIWQYRDNLSIAPRLARWEELNGRTLQARELLINARRTALARRNVPPEQLAWFHLRIGELDIRRGNFREARAVLNAGLELVPDDHRLLGALARAQSGPRKLRHATEYGEQSIAIRLDPATLGTLSDAYAEAGDSAKAAQYASAMEIAVSAQPGPYHRAWALFLLDHDTRTAEVLAKAQEELKTRRDVYGCDIVAWALYKERRYAEAVEPARCALQLGTKDAALYYHAGMIEKALGHEAMAKTWLERALAINPSFHPAQARIAREALESLR